MYQNGENKGLGVNTGISSQAALDSNLTAANDEGGHANALP